MRSPRKDVKRTTAPRIPAGARPGPLPDFLEPSLAQLSDGPPAGPQWVFEIKYDGYRIQARIEGGDVRLLTRKALDWTKRFPTIAAALAKLGADQALLDGEIVSEDERGVRSSAICKAPTLPCRLPRNIRPQSRPCTGWRLL